MSDCRQCVDVDWCAEHEDCGLFKQKPITNADRIRSMTDEELAVWISALYSSQYVAKADPHTWLDWLRKEGET